MTRERTRILGVGVVASVLLATGVSQPIFGGNGREAKDTLVVRYACLVGGRDAGTAPTAGGVMSSDELSQFLLEWQPDADNDEVRGVFALNDLGELARQASEMPPEGMVASGVYAHGDSTFEITMDIRPSRTIESSREVMTIAAEIKRNGKILSAPLIHTPLGERAIITTKDGPEAPFLFLVVEVARVSREELRLRGLKHSWRTDYKLVDGEEVIAPKAIEKVQPVYTVAAKEAKQQGRVVLRMVINEHGAIEDVEVVEGQPYGLTEQAVAAARQWKFEPALHQGTPVPVFYLVTVNFRLE